MFAANYAADPCRYTVFVRDQRRAAQHRTGTRVLTLFRHLSIGRRAEEGAAALRVRRSRRRKNLQRKSPRSEKKKEIPEFENKGLHFLHLIQTGRDNQRFIKKNRKEENYEKLFAVITAAVIRPTVGRK